MQHELITLKNQLQTLFIDAPGNTAGSVQIWFRAGSALEKKEDQGIAHFLEHMFFKGTPTRPGSAIAHEVESFGGELNAFTSFDYTCYYINTPINHLTQTVDILLDMVSNPEFKEEDIVPERGVVFEEFRRSIDNPNQFAFHNLQKNIFTGGYAHPILGTEKNILSFSREQLTSFRNAYYNLSNALFVVSGDLKEKEAIIKKIESYQLPDGGRTTFPAFKLKNSAALDIHQKDSAMVQLSICLQAPPFEDRKAPCEDLAINCLGHGESSQLYQGLVLEESLANTCGSSTMFMNDGGLHYIKIVFPEENLKKILTRLEKLLLTTLKEGLTSEEVQKIKNQYIASKVYDMESLESYAFSLGHSYASSGDISSEEEFIKRIRETSVTQVNESLHEIFKRSLHISVQTPLLEKDNQKKYQQLVENFQISLRKKIDQTKLKDSHKFKSKNSAFDPQVKLIEIKPGIQLVYRYNNMNPTFVLHAYLKGGITEETAKTNGLYQLLSSTLIKGYSNVPYKEMKVELDLLSANMNSFSGKNAYGLTLHGQSEHFKTLVSHFSGTLLKPSFKSEFLKHEKEIAFRALKNHDKDPIKQCFNRAGELMFHNHPYSMSILGTNASIKSISGKVIKDTHLKSLKNKEMLFTYCGDKPLADVIKQLEPLFNELPSRKKVKPKKGKVTPIKGAKEFIYFDREQTQIFTGVPIKALGNKENLALKMLTTHLSGQSSELFVEVRDRQGLCYTAQPIHFTALEAGFWGIYMASGHDKVEAALKAINGILDNIKENGLSKKEFTRIKTMIAGQNLLNIQTNDDYANIYSVTTLQGQKLDFYHENNKKVEELQYEEFVMLLKRVLSQKWSTVIVGKENPWT
jgi:zinc protease